MPSKQLSLAIQGTNKSLFESIDHHPNQGSFLDENSLTKDGNVLSLEESKPVTPSQKVNSSMA